MAFLVTFVAAMLIGFAEPFPAFYGHRHFIGEKIALACFQCLRQHLYADVSLIRITETERRPRLPGGRGSHLQEDHNAGDTYRRAVGQGQHRLDRYEDGASRGGRFAHRQVALMQNPDEEKHRIESQFVSDVSACHFGRGHRARTEPSRSSTKGSIRSLSLVRVAGLLGQGSCSQPVLLS